MMFLSVLKIPKMFPEVRISKKFSDIIIAKVAPELHPFQEVLQSWDIPVWTQDSSE